MPLCFELFRFPEPTSQENTCPLTDICLLKGILCEALAAFYATLDRHTVADLTSENPGLGALLRLPEAA